MSSRQFSYLQSSKAVLSEVEHYNYRAVDCIVFNSPQNLEFKNILPSTFQSKRSQAYVWREDVVTDFRLNKRENTFYKDLRHLSEISYQYALKDYENF